MSERGRPFARGCAFRRFVGIALGLVAAAGCAAQSENYDDRDWTKEHGIQSGAWREVETLFNEGEGDVDRFKHTLRGVRHDLTLKEGAEPDARCSCLDVAIGTPGDPRFAWASKPPSIDPDNLVIAVKPQASCSGAAAGKRPSIQAVETPQDDVRVVIEELTVDRPQALGAVIKKPGLEGALWVRPAGKGMPQARGSKGGACRVPTDPRLHHLQIRAGRRF